MATYCLYHSPCADGMSAAYAVWRLWGDKIQYVPMSYGKHVPALKPGSKLILVDFVFSRPIMEDLAKEHSEIVILDHHATAEETLAGLDEHFCNVLTVFDPNRSGAMITWNYFHPGVRPPLLFNYVQDYDLRRFWLPASKEVNEVIFSYEQDFETWDALCKRAVSQMVPEGEALLRYQQKHIKQICSEPAGAFLGLDKELVPVVNSPYFLRNECCQRLLELFPDAPFAAAYSDTGDGNRHWSLLSEDRRHDVRAVAESRGGGGHRNAAGFRSRRADVDFPFSNFIYGHNA